MRRTVSDSDLARADLREVILFNPKRDELEESYRAPIKWRP